MIFVPSYLNGNDGIFNMSYYDLLIGFDLTLYPSYYEPWGYTPLESLMFHVPTVTTNLSGFGMWVNTYFEDPGNGCLVLNRTDDNEKEVIAGMDEFIRRFMQMSPRMRSVQPGKRPGRYRVLQTGTRSISYYTDAYNFALENSEERRGQPREYARILEATEVQVQQASPGTCMEGYLRAVRAA